MALPRFLHDFLEFIVRSVGRVNQRAQHMAEGAEQEEFLDALVKL